MSPAHSCQRCDQPGHFTIYKSRATGRPYMSTYEPRGLYCLDHAREDLAEALETYRKETGR